MMHVLSQMATAASVAVVLAVLAAGCASPHSASGDAAADSTTAATMPDASATIPEDLTIILGASVGSGGAMRGWSLYADGRVMAWTGRSPENVVQATGTLPADDLAALWHAVQNVDLMTMNRQTLGGATAFINVTAEGAAQRVQWPRGTQRAAADSTLEALYAQLRTTAESALAARGG